MPITTIAIAYTATAAPTITPTSLVAAMESVNLPTGADGDITQITGVTLASDITGHVSSLVTRTITFDVSAEFFEEFPTGSDQAAPFRGIYQAVLANALSTKVTALEPVLT